MCYVGRIWHIESAHACVCFSYSHQSLNSDEKLFPPKISTMGSLGFLSKSLSKIANRYFIFFLKKSGKSWSLMTDSKKKKTKVLSLFLKPGYLCEHSLLTKSLWAFSVSQVIVMYIYRIAPTIFWAMFLIQIEFWKIFGRKWRWRQLRSWNIINQ